MGIKVVLSNKLGERMEIKPTKFKNGKAVVTLTRLGAMVVDHIEIIDKC